jgi:uncharacterized membrane protein
MFLYFLFPYVLFVLLDAVFWKINGQLIELQVIDVQRTAMKVNLLPAIICYLVIFFTLYWFILRTRRSVLDAALLGGAVNAIFELTNFSILKHWHLNMVVLDIFWGAFLWGFVVFATYRLETFLK